MPIAYKTISIQLKACPFCGSESSLLWRGEGSGFRAACTNEDCGCELPPWVLHEKDEDVLDTVLHAAEYWNKRVES